LVAERLGRFEVDDELKFGGLVHRQARRLLACDNTRAMASQMVAPAMWF
jgi:hypothetical protein